VGNFGGGRFFDYTAYGDTINVTARLEVANKVFGTRVLISSALAARAEDFHGRPVGDLVLRGKTEPIRASEPLRANKSDEPCFDSYHKAFALLEAGDPKAMGVFAAHVGNYPTDQLSSFHLKRLLSGHLGTKIVFDQ
jgi:adenylate cyclase